MLVRIAGVAQRTVCVSKSDVNGLLMDIGGRVQSGQYLLRAITKGTSHGAVREEPASDGRQRHKQGNDRGAGDHLPWLDAAQRPAPRRSLWPQIERWLQQRQQPILLSRPDTSTWRQVVHLVRCITGRRGRERRTAAIGTLTNGAKAPKALARG